MPSSRRTRRRSSRRAWRSTCRSRGSWTSTPRRRACAKERDEARRRAREVRAQALQRGLPREGGARDRREGPRQGRRARRVARAGRGAARRAGVGGVLDRGATWTYDDARRGARARARLRHQPVARRHHARCATRSGGRRTRSRSVQVDRHQRQDLDRAPRRTRCCAPHGRRDGALHEPAARALSTSASRSAAGRRATSSSPTPSSAALEAAERAAPRRGRAAPAGFTEFELLTAAALWLFRERGVDIAVLEVGHGRPMGRDECGRRPRSPSSPASGSTTRRSSATRSSRSPPRRPPSSGRPARPSSGPGTEGLEAVFLARAARGARTHARVVREAGAPTPVGRGADGPLRGASRSAAPARADVDRRARRARRRTRASRSRRPRIRPPTSPRRSPRPRRRSGGHSIAPRSRAALASRHASRAASRSCAREPPVVVDGAHNPQAAAVLAERDRRGVARRGRSGRRVLLGVLADKDAARHRRGARAGRVPASSSTAPDSPRALPAADLARVGRRGHRAAGRRRSSTLPDAVALTARRCGRRACRHRLAHDGRGGARRSLRDDSATARGAAVEAQVRSARIRAYPRARARAVSKGTMMGELLDPISEQPARSCSRGTCARCSSSFSHIALVFWT